jgi:hypothetical protein
MNDNQNCFVTRSTSRVLSEPGGKSSTSFLFGGSTSAKAVGVVKAPAETTPEKTAVGSATNAPKTAAAAGAVSVAVAGSSGPAPGELSPFAAAARIKSKQETNSFSLFGGGGATAVSSNAYASSSATNSYNVLTDRSTSRVVSLCVFISPFPFSRNRVV